ncbi:MAG: M48 family metallopeptidase [Phycisphaerales bacterium]|jgi:hypothetical protein
MKCAIMPGMANEEDRNDVPDAPADRVANPSLERLRFRLDDPQRTVSGEGMNDFEREEIRHRIRMTMVRASERLMPDVHRASRRACERLGIEHPPEVFVQAEPTPNAHILMDGGEPIVLLHSGLFSILEPDELCTVIGHELGHWGLRHPPPGPEDESTVVTALSREAARAAEVSADRVAMVAAGDFRSALRVEIKLACGLGSKHVRLDDLDAFMDELETGPIESDRQWEAFSTHPEMQFRFWAQHQFSQTDRFRSVLGRAGGLPYVEVESAIEDRFLALGGGLAFRWTVDALHEALAWIGVLLVAEDEVVTDEEHERLVRLVGMVWAEDATTYARRHGLDAVRRRAKETLQPLKAAHKRTRDRLEQSILKFAKAIGAEDRGEQAIMMVRSAWAG